MVEKYYTPSIEEFHVGFEHELKQTNGWTKEVCFFIDDQTKLDIQFQRIRVKCLDKQDIEECGWIKEDYCIHFENERLLFKDDYVLYKKEKDHIVYYIEFLENIMNGILSFKGKVLIHIWNNETMDIKANNKPIALFNGCLKNKSELKKLMKQLNIF